MIKNLTTGVLVLTFFLITGILIMSAQAATISTPPVSTTPIRQPTATMFPTVTTRNNVSAPSPSRSVEEQQQEPIQQEEAQPTVEPTPDTRCIITVDGRRFDVSAFKTNHSGGDIFSCGTDMSQVFHGQHAQSYLDQIAQYEL